MLPIIGRIENISSSRYWIFNLDGVATEFQVIHRDVPSIKEIVETSKEESWDCDIRRGYCQYYITSNVIVVNGPNEP